MTSVGIFWGFKKPLAFVDFAAISSVSYTAVLRNTFNLVVTTPHGDIEFGMVDQADYTGINEYIQKHHLQDASMAADRRAKKLNVNPPADKANGTKGRAADEGGLSELQKAEQELQDLEDEDEEDYDPENEEEESDGSGSDSEDEGGEDDDGDEEDFDEGADEEME